MFLIIILLLLLILISYSKEKFNQSEIIKDKEIIEKKECDKIIKRVVTERELQIPDIDENGKTKCFACENQIKKELGKKFIKLGQTSKCFSCDKQLINKNK